MNTDETPNPDGKDAAASPAITLIEINNHLANLSDQDRAEAFYDLAVNGFSSEDEDGDSKVSHLDRSVVLAAIAGWTVERASLALYNFESKLIAEQVAQTEAQKDKGESAAAHEFTD